MELIGENCVGCGERITANDDEAQQYFIDDATVESGRKYVPDTAACCLECVFDAQDGDYACACDDAERGTDYRE